MDHQDFQKIRREYEDNGIEAGDLAECPIAQLKIWLEQAQQHSPGPWFESNAVALATADREGNVSVRYVLIKGIDQAGIRFFTNYDSEKSQQLAANPRCSLAIHWPFMGRQLRISGSVAKTSAAVSQEYFHSRPRGAQIGAAVSNQSGKLASRKELEDRWAKFDAETADAAIERPDNWGGFEITPERFEFWQGRTSRLHDRIVYEPTADGWSKFRLAP